MATKKRTKTTKTKKNSAQKRIPKTPTSSAPYILIIMAMAAGLLYLLSLQSDSIKNLIPKKNIPIVEKKNNIADNDARAEKKDMDNITKNTRIKDIAKQESLYKEKPKEKEIATIKAKVYFLFYNEQADKVELRSVVRNVDANIPVKAALEELIKGPTRFEEKKGYVTAIPPNLKVINVSIVNNIAFVNFNAALEEGAAGNIMLNRVDQIVYTATQFDNVNGIHILINGQRKRFLGADGISIAGPLKSH